MKRTASISITMLLLGVTTGFAETVSGNRNFLGRWSRDCDRGRTCHLEINEMKSKQAVEITFSVEGNGPSCKWSVNAVYDLGFGGPVARDPHGNYYFYLTRQKDGRLYSSGTILSNCGPQPTDQYFTSDDDAQSIVDNREVFDHNGSAMILSPSQGTIVYRDPKKSIADTVKRGALLFKASAAWDPYDDAAVIRGTAYVFKRGCEPAPYEVSGRQYGWHTLVLKGAAPVRAKTGCEIVGYKMNGNSTLKFVSWGD